MSLQRYVVYLRECRAQQFDIDLDGQRLRIEKFLSTRPDATVLGTYIEPSTTRRSKFARFSVAASEVQAYGVGATLLVACLGNLTRDPVFLGLLVDANIEFESTDFQANRQNVGLLLEVCRRQRELVASGFEYARRNGRKPGNPNGASHLKGIGNVNAVTALKSRADAYAIIMAPVLARLTSLSAGEVAKELNRRGIKTSRDGQWCPRQVVNTRRRLEAHGSDSPVHQQPPARKGLRNAPRFDHGFRDNPDIAGIINPSLKGIIDPRAATVVSFFSGGGGLDLGLLGGFNHLGKHYPALPFRIVGAYDNGKAAVEAYRLNLGNPIHHLDLSSTDMRQLPAADVLVGGFPCQSFSINGNRKGLECERRGKLYLAMVDYMATHRPKVVIGENVPFLAKIADGATIRQIISDLERVGYDVRWSCYDLPDYGLPSSRRRIIFTCVREDMNRVHGFPESPKPTHIDNWVPIDDAIGDLIAVTDESIANQAQFCVARRALGGNGQGDETSQAGKIGYLVRANGASKVHFHYKLNRRLTVRECARLMGFPDEFVFPHFVLPNLGIIGNAVPPIFGHHLGRSLAKYFERMAGPEVAGAKQSDEAEESGRYEMVENS